MVGLVPILILLVVFIAVGTTAGEFDRRVRQRLLLAIAVFVGVLYAVGLR